MLGNTINLPGDTVNINDIGEQPTDRNNPGMTLVCVATNVNSACCRGNDNNNGGPLGDLLYPNKTSVSAISVLEMHLPSSIQYDVLINYVSVVEVLLLEYTCV